MKRAGLKKKILLPIMLVLTGSVLTVALVVYNNLTRVDADPVFDGVTNIVNNKNETNSTFNIVELVPNKDMGTIGYLVSGQEPDDISDSALSAIVKDGARGTDDRNNYINELKNKLASIISEQNDDSKPLYYENYEESYAQNDDSWKEIDLAGNETIIASESNGYSMEEVENGKGDYDLVKYVPTGSSEVTESGESCNQNVDYYVYLDSNSTTVSGYYNVDFELVTLPAGQTNTAYFGEKDDQENYVRKAYKLVSSTDSNNNKVDKYVYVPFEDIVDDETYYTVNSDSVAFCADGSGKYGAVLDKKEPYVSVDSTGSIVSAIGNFQKIGSDDTYSYVGEGQGKYVLKADENSKLDKNVITSRIYYKGGLKSNDWFRNKVLGGDENVKIRVKTVVPSEFNNMSVEANDLDFLYVSEASLDGNSFSEFSTNSNDISKTKANELLNRILNGNPKLPVAIDGSIIDRGDIYNGENIERVLMLAVSDFEGKNSATSIESFGWWQIYNKIKTFSDYPNGYVSDNLYVVPNSFENNRPGLLYKFIDIMATCSNATEKSGCKDVAKYIKTQNSLRKSKGEKLLSENISMATNISYIIAVASKQVNKINEINVLEIEPGAMKTQDINIKADDVNAKYLNCLLLKKWLGSACPDYDNINIKVVSMAEFIGRVEDLSKYDMIYMGLNTELFNVGSDGKTVYNDSNMNGLIYSNVGDIVVIDPTKNGHAGLLDSDYVDSSKKTLVTKLASKKSDTESYISEENTYRSSGNDITNEKISALIKYLDGNYPIVLGYGFFNNDAESTVNDTYIDSNSKMYSFLNSIKDRGNVIQVDSAKNATGIYDYISMEKPQINLVEQKKVDGQKYVDLKTNKIALDFSVDNIGDNAKKGSTFVVKLYIDSNVDGKFAEGEQIPITQLKLYKKDEDNKTTVSAGQDSNGKSNYIVETGTDYTIEYDLPENYVGLISWKLVVCQTDNSNRYDFKYGYAHMAATAETRIKINILQIMPYNANDFGSLQAALEKKFLSNFDDFVDEVKDYDINVTSVKLDELLKICDEGKLTTYNLVLLGFDEHYSIGKSDGSEKQKEQKALNYIKSYIDNGYPVVITHGTTSYYNFDDSSNNSEWGYAFNMTLRDVVGMDRYGITKNSALKKGIQLTEGTGEYNEALDYAEKNKTDVAYVPVSGATEKNVTRSIAKQNQGFTYADLNKYQEKWNGHGNYNLYKDLDSSADTTTQEAVEINEGQTTIYPFNLDNGSNNESGRIQVTHTYFPCYQLNLDEDDDNDGETDLVVWYALHNRWDTTKLYSKSQGDVRNNYYMYTKGNVTYLGASCTDLRYEIDSDLKIFINTAIAAYETAPHEPNLLLKEGYDRNSADVSSLYSTIDDAIEQENKDEANLDSATQDVYFTVSDTNSLRYQLKNDTKVHANFYIECSLDEKPDKTIESKGQTINLKEVDWEIYSLNSDGSQIDPPISPKIDSDGNTVIRDFFDNDKTYKIKVPISVLPKGKNSIKVYVIAYSELYKQKKGSNDPIRVNSPEICKTFDIRRLGLADLD